MHPLGPLHHADVQRRRHRIPPDLAHFAEHRLSVAPNHRRWRDGWRRAQVARYAGNHTGARGHGVEHCARVPVHPAVDFRLLWSLGSCWGLLALRQLAQLALKPAGHGVAARLVAADL